MTRLKIVVAPDSFKGSLKSPAAARAMAAGARAACPGAEVVELPVGDGGEGTLDALVAATGGACTEHEVLGPLGEPVRARLGLLPDGETVFVEMAEASGLSLVPAARRDARGATTYGTGQLLRAAFDSGRRRILVGIGGSATTDGGAGALQALGVRFRDSSGTELVPGESPLPRIAAMDLSGLALPPDRRLLVACDVTNPLCGPDGAAAVYGPQKGASPEDVSFLDGALLRFAELSAGARGSGVSAAAETPGAGAAGGLGFALLAFLGARLERGVTLVLDAIGFDAHVAGADLVLTGEGRIDRQTTAFGKTLTGIGARARAAGVPVLALAGALGEDLGDYRAAGLSGVASILPRPMPLEAAMADAPRLLEDAARRLVEVFLAGRGAARPPA